jgi:tetratricopeptide (TPR) repeat protein
MKIAFLCLLLVLFPQSPNEGKFNEDFNEAKDHYERGKFEEAVSQFSALSRSFPDNPELRLWLGKSYLKTRKWDRAVKEMEEAVRLNPSDAHLHLWLGRACGAQAEHSIFFRAIGRARRVLREFEKARDLAPQDLDIRFDLLEFYIAAPGIVGGGKDKAEAEAKVIAYLNPEMGYIARATIFEKAEKWELAKKELLQATLDFPDYANAYKDLAYFLLGRKDYEGALSYSQKALELDGKSKLSRLVMAAAKTQMRRDLEGAESSLQELASSRLTDDDPTFEEVYYWLGKCYLAQGDRAKAYEALKTALAFNPDYDPAKKEISELR